MEKKAAIGERIKEIMRMRSLSYDALGELLEMKAQTLNRYVLGQREPKASVVYDMAQKLGVDSRWLQGYDVPMLEKSCESDGIQIRKGLCVTECGLSSLSVVLWNDNSGEEGSFLWCVGDDVEVGIECREADVFRIRCGDTAENGQVVLFANESGKLFLRRYRRQGDVILLQSDNPDHEFIMVKSEDVSNGALKIYGIATEQIRTL